MQKYDVTLKLLLRNSSGTLMQALAGRSVVEWLNVELPEFRNRRVDLLCRLSDGTLLHIELQSANDREMAVRMAEYALAIYRQFGQFPHQIVLYVGRAAMRMPTTLAGERFAFGYEARDLRDLDGDKLIASDQVGDNILAVLARLRNRKGAVGQILQKIAELKGADREAALGQLIVLAGLRGLEDVVEKEIRKVPVFIDITKNKVIGREYRRGKAEGFQAGELNLLRRQVQKRFGSIPEWAEEQMSLKTPEELELLGLKLLDARTVEELLQ